MKKYFLLLIVFLTPITLLADQNKVSCEGKVQIVNKESLPDILLGCGNAPGCCGFEQLILVVNALLKWAMLGLASTATIMFVYAGFLYMSAQGDPNQVKKAHGIFKVVLIGFVIILLAYLLVQEFLKYFMDPNSSNIYKLLNNK